MANERGSRLRRAGIGLLELLISVAALGVIMTAVAMVQVRSNDESASMVARTTAEANACRVLDRVAEELTGVGKTLLFPDPTTTFGASTLVFQRPIGVSNAGVKLWGNPSRLELRMGTGELDNGADDNSDGLIDEREIALTRDFGTGNARTIVLCTNIADLAPGELVNGVDDNGNGVVDEAGFNVRRVGDLLNVRVCVEQPFAGDQVTRSWVDTSIVLHN